MGKDKFKWGQRLVPSKLGKQWLGSTLQPNEGIYVGKSVDGCIAVIEKGKRRQTIYHRSFWKPKYGSRSSRKRR